MHRTKRQIPFTVAFTRRLVGRTRRRRWTHGAAGFLCETDSRKRGCSTDLSWQEHRNIVMGYTILNLRDPCAGRRKILAFSLIHLNALTGEEELKQLRTLTREIV